MNEELKELLKFYEDEKESLEDMIKSYVEDFEYKAAYFHSKGLKKVNQKIQLLKNLNNPNSDQIAHLQRTKKMYEVVIPSLINNVEYSNYQANQKTKIDSQIENLINQNRSEKLDGQEFDDVIFSLIENRIKSFKFYLNKASDVYLDFKKDDKYLIISIPNYQHLRDQNILRKSSIKALKSIGFKKDKIKKSLFLIYPLINFKNAIEIKMLTSRIVYDGIGYFNINNLSIIKIIE